MRKILIMIIICCIALCSGCERSAMVLPIQQSTDNITHVQMVDNREDKHKIIREISGDELQGFIQDMVQLECMYYWNDPAGLAGAYYIAVFYKNGDKEIIGTSTIGYINSCGEQEWPYEKDYYVTRESMEELFEKYSIGQRMVQNH